MQTWRGVAQTKNREPKLMVTIAQTMLDWNQPRLNATMAWSMLQQEMEPRLSAAGWSVLLRREQRLGAEMAQSMPEMSGSQRHIFISNMVLFLIW